MIDLDDVAALRAVDASDMLGTVASLPSHVVEAYARGRSATGLPTPDGVTGLVFCGMGGSAVAGDLLKQGFRERLGIPVEVSRSPLLPLFAGPHTLVVVSSYSGNTSETLSSFSEAVERGCRILAITSGGELGSACEERGFAAVRVPSGFPPRAALGHLSFAMLGALEVGGLLPPLEAEVDGVVAALKDVGRAFGAEVPTVKNPGKEAATWLEDRVPVIWGAEGIGAVAAMRWKTQMNENGKVPAFHAAMSELDHNEVVGWVRPFGERFAVIALRHDAEHEHVAARFQLSADIARDAGATTREFWVTGRRPLATLLSFVIIGDYISCYVGLRRGIDPTPVEAIDRLKAALAGA